MAHPQGGRGVVKGGKGHPLPIFDTTKRCVFETNAQARFVIVILDGSCVSVNPEVTYASRLRAPCYIKKPFKGPRQGVVGRKDDKSVSSITQVSKRVCLSIPFIKEATKKGSRKEHCMRIKEKQNISSQSF